MKTEKIITFLLLIIITTVTTALAKDLIIQGSVAEMYDDNINNSSNDPKTDYITNLMLGLGINLEGKTQTLRLLGHIYQELYYKQSSFNNNSQDIILNYTKEFTSRDRFMLNNTFQHYPEPRDFQYMYGQSEGRNGYYTNSLNLAFDKDLINDFAINLYYINVITRASSEALNDSMSNGAGFSLNYSINAFNIISLLYDYNNTQYESGGRNNEEDNIQHTAGLGYQHYFTRQLSASCKGGIEYIKSRNDTQSTPYFILSVVDNIDAKNIINVSVSRRYQTTLLTNEVYDSWTFSALFIRQISARLTFSLSMFYQYGYIVSSLSNTENSLLGITTSGNYYLNENIFLSAKYTYTRTINKQTRPMYNNTKYDRNQIQLSANTEY